MAKTNEGPHAIRSFVGAARGLIVAQVVVALAALGAGGWAVLKVREATDAKAIAEAEREAAQTAKNEAAERIKQSQDYAALLAEFTRASDSKGLADAISSLTARIEQQGGADARVYALLAAAYFRSGNVFDAAGAAAARRNGEALQQLREIGADTELNEQLYLDLAAYRCAANFAKAEVVSAVGNAPAPALAVLAVDGESGVAAHSLMRRDNERWPQCRQWVQEHLAMEAPRLAQAGAQNDLFRIKIAFVQAPPNLDGPARDRAIAILEQNQITVPPVETIARDFAPGVRFYHAEQQAEAERIAAALRGGASGEQWSAANFRTQQIAGSGLPRDRIEVWLPGAAPPQALTSLDVYYYRHVADGLLIEEILQRRLSNFEPRRGDLLSEDRANTIACHPRIDAAAFAEFKALAISLVEAGAPIGRIGVIVNNVDAKPSNRVDIIASARANGVLTVQEIQGLDSCRVLDAQARRAQ
jgi:hypothetical protein